MFWVTVFTSVKESLSLIGLMRTTTITEAGIDLTDVLRSLIGLMRTSRLQAICKELSLRSLIGLMRTRG